MADVTLLDRAFHNIMQRFIHTGQAPHYTELAKDLGLPVEEGRQLIVDLMAAGVRRSSPPLLRGYSASSLSTSFSTTVPLKKSGFMSVQSLAGLTKTKSRKFSSLILPSSTNS